MLQSTLVIDARLPEITQSRRTAIDIEGLQSALSTPLKTHKALLGLMSITTETSLATWI